MRSKAWTGMVALLTGCGPLVSLPADTDGDSGGASSGFSDAGDEDTTPSSVTGIPPETTLVTTDNPDGDGSTSGFGPDFGDHSPTTGAVEQCWRAVGLLTLPADSRLFAVDQNGDGEKELWISLFLNGDGPDGFTDIFVIDPSDLPEFAGNFPGFATGLADIDGDGLEDVVGFEFRGGGPPRLSYMRSIGNGVLSNVTEQTTLGIADGFLAFADLDEDGFEDAIRNREPPLTLLSGSGSGEFVETALDPFADEARLFGDVASFETDGLAPFEALLFETDLFEDPGACEPHNHAIYANDRDLMLPQRVNGTPTDPSIVSTRPLGISGFAGDSQAVFTRGCIPNQPGSEAILAHVIGFKGTSAQAIIADAELVSMGDFNGDGIADLADARDDTVSFFPGNGDDFLAVEQSSVDVGVPIPNRVYALDTDLDGRDEIIYAVEAPDNAIELRRLDLGPC